MKVKIFWQNNCPSCPTAKKLGKALEEKEIEVQYYNVNEVNGLAEACFYNIFTTPSIIITNDYEKEIKIWKGEVPFLEDILKEVNNGE